MRTFIWASAHQPTEEQIKSLEEMGHLSFLKDTHPELHNTMCNMQLDTNLVEVAFELHNATKGSNLVQPAGSPAFHMVLGRQTFMEQDTMFSFSQRVSQDQPQADGSVRKVTIFRHEGWITV